MSDTREAAWPQLPTTAWRDTCATLHLWTQVAGKIRLSRSPWLNPFLACRAVRHRTRADDLADPGRFARFRDRVRLYRSSLADVRPATARGGQLPLAGQSVASFYTLTIAALAELGIHVTIDEMPNELPDRSSSRTTTPTPPTTATRRGAFFKILTSADRVFKQFRTGFLGKASPVHFFWGSFDLAVTRFSGRRAPRHPGGVPHLSDAVACEAYSHEGKQRRLLAGQRRDRLSRVLFLCLSRAGRIPRHQGEAGRGVLPRDHGRIHPAL